MRCIPEFDVRAFAEAVLPWLAQEPFLNNVVSTVITARAEGGQAIEPGALWLRVVDRGTTVTGVAVMTPPRGLLLSEMSPSAARAVGAWITDEIGTVPTAEGPLVVSAAFRDAYVARTGATAAPGPSMRVFRLDQVDHPTSVRGSARPAGGADRDLLVDWSVRFGREIHGHPVDDSAAAIDRRLSRTDAQLIWLWEVDGRAASMAYLSDPVARVSRVSGVYTPESLRGHGYASGVVASISQHAIDSGSVACTLNTDLANPTSNKIYQAVGYRPVGDVQRWIFATRH